VLWGYRKSDWCDAVVTTFAREVVIDDIHYIAPLYDLTEDQVGNALDALDLTYVTDDHAEFCEECLSTIISLDWDKDAALAGFRSRYHFNQGV
jgi:hypothetical protein